MNALHSKFLLKILMLNLQHLSHCSASTSYQPSILSRNNKMWSVHFLQQTKSQMTWAENMFEKKKTSVAAF